MRGGDVKLQSVHFSVVPGFQPGRRFQRRGNNARSRGRLEMNNFISAMKQQMPGEQAEEEAKRDEVEPYQRAASGFPALVGDVS